jgi:hypothetical protein
MLLKRRDLEQIKIDFPVVPEMEESEENVIKIVEELTEKIYLELEKILEFANRYLELDGKQINSLRDYYREMTFYHTDYDVTDDNLFYELNRKYQEENLKFFELNLKLTESGCDEYEIEYLLKSELYRFFHEDPDIRRERLEVPIRRELENVDKNIKRINKEIDKISFFRIKNNEDLIMDKICKFIDKIMKFA